MIGKRAHPHPVIRTVARFEVIEGAGHWVQYEAAERFNPLFAEIVRARLEQAQG